jgi:hypothetical protein
MGALEFGQHSKRSWVQGISSTGVWHASGIVPATTCWILDFGLKLVYGIGDFEIHILGAQQLQHMNLECSSSVVIVFILIVHALSMK